MTDKKITELMGFVPSDLYRDLEDSIANEVHQGTEGLKRDLLAVRFFFG